MYSDMQNALERTPESMHPEMPRDKRDAGVVSFRSTFTNQSVDEREGRASASRLDFLLGESNLLTSH